ncbi:hypothetical protein MMPV_001644 [Pyropia vietnamensis]
MASVSSFPAPAPATLPPPAAPTEADITTIAAAIADFMPAFLPRPVGSGSSTTAASAAVTAALPEFSLLRRSTAAAAWMDPDALLCLPTSCTSTPSTEAMTAAVVAGVTPAALAASFAVDAVIYLVDGGDGSDAAVAADTSPPMGIGPCTVLLSTLYVPVAMDEQGVLLGATVHETPHNLLTPLTGGAWAMPPAGRFAYDLVSGDFLLGGAPPVPSAAHGRAVTYNSFELVRDNDGLLALRWTETRLAEPPLLPSAAQAAAAAVAVDDSPTCRGDDPPHRQTGRASNTLFLTDRSVALMRRTDAWPLVRQPAPPTGAVKALAEAVGGLGTFGVSAVEDDGRGSTRLLPPTIYSSGPAGVGMACRLRSAAAAAVVSGRVHPGALRLSPPPPPASATAETVTEASRVVSPPLAPKGRPPPRTITVLGGVSVAPGRSSPPPRPSSSTGVGVGNATAIDADVHEWWYDAPPPRRRRRRNVDASALTDERERARVLRNRRSAAASNARKRARRVAERAAATAAAEAAAAEAVAAAGSATGSVAAVGEGDSEGEDRRRDGQGDTQENAHGDTQGNAQGNAQENPQGNAQENG